MNVLIAIGSFYDGGAEIFAIRLANALSESRQVVFVELQPYETDKKSQRKLLSPAVKVIQLGKNVPGFLLHKYLRKGRVRQRLKHYYNASVEQTFGKVLKEYNIQVVHSHCLQTDIYFTRLKSKYSFKLATTLHGHYELEQKEKLLGLFESNHMQERTDKYVWVTQQQNETLDNLKVPNKKRNKIYYGIPGDIAKACTVYTPDEPLKIVMAARGIPEKGWKETIDACLLLLKKFPGKLQLTLLGDGVFIDELRSLYNHTAIHFYGYIEDVLPFIEDAHIAVLPSYYKAESLPNSIIEYLFCGKPVIATSIGAVEEMISYNHERAGILIGLVHEKVAVQDIADAIQVYLENPELVAQHSVIALQAAQKFDMKQCVDSYTALYEEMLNEPVMQQ
ncbi:glycosyltransferase family 4 protein [Panacibacter ginsenosidivorans]|uniref:Glycosyltransferase family 4 protein n=1 Tax=Panacibacter ginsenosidivorans TaxID=1813871 RepID=A0A5B8VDE4_9BACT|nr:glycosyltransferase family 4 protein [Panacibacter ginsenosidivorans]QEC69075.1 glycosyltransferase family 4 protein [Panacibacter ginsenosidivorans]